MPRKRTRRQPHGSAWYWKQTQCWYYTPPGTKQRQPLFDEQGQRIRGPDNQQAADLALARLKLAAADAPAVAPAPASEWLVARVCSEYIQYCRQGAERGTLSRGHCDTAVAQLNDLCRYCGALPVRALTKGHIREWVARHQGWKSPATERSALTVVLAAFNYADANFEVASPLKGLKKPRAQPRLHSLSHADEEALYQATDAPFADFLRAAFCTGLRPFCELARLTAEMVSETERGMLWRIHSSKTDKVRKIPVRPEVAVLTRRLLQTAPAGSGLPLFRNPQGRAWKKVTAVARFRQLRRKLHWDQDPVRQRYSCYSCRHTFAHRMLSGYWNGGVGCSIETLAELLGDTPKVAFDHYGREWGQHFQEPLWLALGVGAAARAVPADAEAHAANAATDPAPRGRRPRRGQAQGKAL